MKNVNININDIKEMVTTTLLVLSEGMDTRISANGDKVDVSLNSNTDDLSNKVFDTRLFGSKNDILNGDGTSGRSKRKGINGLFASKDSMVKTYQSIIDYINNGRPNNWKPYVDKFTTAKTLKNIDEILKLPDKEALFKANKYLKQRENVSNVYRDTFQRINNLQDGETGERYIKGVVPGTNIKFISLFRLTDFNASDILKNGTLRQNGDLTKSLNMNDMGKEFKLKGNAQLKKIQATYDNGITPDLDNNFSLQKNASYDNAYLNDTHFARVNREYGDKNYTTISKFIDKSIMYAAYVLKKEGLIPKYIVAAPSSSRFNDNYCMRLSNKIGSEYVTDFFRRNLINVEFDREGLLSSGMNEEKVNSIEREIRCAVQNETTAIISQPVKNFFNKYKSLFSNISYRKYGKGRNILPLSTVQAFVLNNAYKILLNEINNMAEDINDNVTRMILNGLFISTKVNEDKEFNGEFVQKQIIQIIRANGLLKEFTLSLRKMTLSMMSRREKLINGFNPNFENRKFKITDINEMVRPFLKNCYIIADSELNKDKNLLTRYQNCDFVIFDEDMQSGGTLKLLIQCMLEKGVSPQNITCLVQAYGE